MKKFFKKVLVLIILFLITMNNFSISVYAVYNTLNIENEIATNNESEIIKKDEIVNTELTKKTENETSEKTQDEINQETINTQNLLNNNQNENIREEVIEGDFNKESSINSYDVLLAGILSRSNELTYSEVEEIIQNNNFNNKSGIWTASENRQFIQEFINGISNNIYSFDSDGFLIKTDEKQGNDIREAYFFYTQKIEEIVNSGKTIIIEINNEYKSLNEFDNQILNMFMEEKDYSMLFNDPNNELHQIVLLNNYKYNSSNEFESLATLMNHFIELFYNEDEEFIEYISDKINYAQTYSLNNLTMKDNNNTEEQYKIALAGILNDNIDNFLSVNEILSNKNNKTGMWISEKARSYIINLINTTTQMTYGVDEDGYLYVLSSNGIEEKNYNWVEKCLKEIINGDKTIIIDLNNYYMEKLDDSNKLEKFNIERNEYKKVFNISSSKIIITNSDLFNAENEDDTADILLSYVLEEFVYEHEKQLEIDENSISPYYSGDIIGNMNSSQNVYAGPSNENYAKVGSVSVGEEIHVLEGEFGWYQIRYETSSGKKVGFVPKESVNNVYMSDTSVPYQNGGLAFSKSGNLNIYYGYPTTDYVKVGSIYEGEGVTFLQKVGDFAYVEYASSSGTKRGLVEYSKLNIIEKSSVARVTRTASAYAGPDTDFVKLGGAYYNEYVIVLEKMEDWVYVEYNTSSGRKCGFMSAKNLDIFKSIYFYDFSEYNGLKKATQQLNVYGGPNNNYAKLGTIYSQEVVSYLRSIERVGKQWAYIEYNTNKGAKRGYVEASKLIDSQNPSIPTITQYQHFSTGTYYPNKTVYNNDLRYYSIGNGNNTLFMIYGQHGWEDAWAADSVELVKIANDVMNNLSNFYNENQSVFDYWKIYIIPSANPDGITNGYSNNGPGRCTVESGRRIDMNRSWPANFSPYYTSRNYTGSYSLGRKDVNDYGAGEIRGLKDFIDSKKGNNNIILDVHGWLNQTYGDLGLGRYFSNNFGFKTNGTYGTGYLIRYGQSIGAKSCLVELPMPSSSASIINDNYSGKLSNSLRELLVGEMGQVIGGEEVNESCKIVSTGNVNVRQQPNTSSNIVTSLTNGTIVTRIKKSVTNSNGYTWDKIKLSDQREGYIATNFLQIVQNNDIIFQLNDSDTSIQALKAYLRYNNINNYNDTPTSILDEETISTIKVFQNSNGLTQTGIFDRYTIETMGFALNSENKIEENSYYNQYLQYALNYINYGNPTQVTYVEIPVYLDDLQRYNKFIYDRDYTSISPYTQNTINDMEAKYNKMGQAEKDQKANELSNIENKFNNMANNFFANMLMKNAAASLRRYMDKSGAELLHENIPEEIKKNTGHYDVYKTYVKRAADAAEKFVPEGNREYKFSLEYEASAQFGNSNKNLWASIGKYRIEMICYVTKFDNTYTMNVKYQIKDYYDWIEGSQEVFDFGITSVVENDGFLLHYSGRAKAFHQKGSPIEDTFEWQKGNSQSVI